VLARGHGTVSAWISSSEATTGSLVVLATRVAGPSGNGLGTESPQLLSELSLEHELRRDGGRFGGDVHVRIDVAGLPGGLHKIVAAVEVAGQRCAQHALSAYVLTAGNRTHVQAVATFLAGVASRDARDSESYAHTIYLVSPHIYYLLSKKDKSGMLSAESTQMQRSLDEFLGGLVGHATLNLGPAQTAVKVGLRSLWTGGSFSLAAVYPVLGAMQSYTVDYVHDALARAIGSPILLDVGANTGSFTLLAKALPVLQVHAFEPGQIAYSELLENVQLNGLERQVTTYNVAVGRNHSTATVEFNPFLTGLSVLSEAGDKRYAFDVLGTDEVEVVPLDSYGFNRVDVLKIDTEGFEESVLLGAAQSIRRFHPIVVIELATLTDPAKVLLESWGYVGVKLRGMSKASITRPSGDWAFTWQRPP
jgi:FkbM family methyltransferase